jgi:hypothetical protein
MPIENGTYQKLSKEEIQARLEAELLEQLDTTAELGELVTQQLAAEAETLANNQEQALERVHNAAYLEDATGRELEKVVDIIGLQRQPAVGATTVARFSRKSPPEATYTIPSGTVVQTGGSDTLEYEITQQGALRYVSGFENGTLDGWAGDVSAFDASSGALEIPATSNVSITTDRDNYKVGTTFSLSLTPGSGATAGFRFGVQDQSNYYECEVSQLSQDLYLRLVEDGSETALSTNSSADIPTNEVYVELTWGLHESSSVVLYESEQRDVELCSTELTADAGWERGAFSVSSLNGDTTSLVDDITTRAVLLNAKALDTGPKTNIGPNAIQDFKGGVTGVETVANPVAAGNPQLENTDRAALLPGEEEEDDEELRERAFNSTAIGGAATVNALDTAIRQVDGVESLTLNRNREGTSVDGMPAKSFEPVVYGGADKDVAKAIFNTASVDSNDVGGINGTAASYTVTSSVTQDTEQINWSRPTRLNLTIELSLVVDDTYVGENEIRSIIVEHIGGTGLNGTFTNGLNVGDDIYMAVLGRKIVNPEETGVWEVDNISVDKDNDGTDDITTTTSGAEILAVSNNEVAVTNARDGSITVTTTQK